jgi:hypothetical protein
MDDTQYCLDSRARNPIRWYTLTAAGVDSSQHHADPAASPSATARAVTAAAKPRPRKPGRVATFKIPVYPPNVTPRLVVTG